MVKRGLVLIFLLLAIMPISYAAVTVTLVEPIGTVSNNHSVTFSCNAVSNSSTLSIVMLYFGTELTWNQNKTVAASGLTNSAHFVVDGIPNGNFLWNCKAVDSLNAESFGPANNSFTVNVPPPAPPRVNTLPNLKVPISPKRWYNGEILNLILQDYFEDVDNDNLTFTVAGNSKINITIQDGYVTFTPAADWIGSEKVIFTANDGNASTPSNEVLLNVTERNGKSNQPPILVQKSPLESIYSPTKQGEIFSITVTDPENGTLSYNWKLDRIIVGNGKSYSLNNVPLGNHTLIAEYSDGVNSGNYTWALIVKTALNAPVNNNPPAKPIAQAPVCGDSKRDINENCQNCPKDAPCDKGFNCVTGGKCQKKSALALIITIIFIFMALLTAGYFAYEYLLKDKIARFFMKKETQPNKKEVESIQNAVKAPAETTPVIKPDFLVQKPEIIPKQKPATTTAQQPKPVPIKPVKKEDTLKLYVAKMFGKGHSLQEINDNLLKVGWPKAKVDETIKAIKLNKESKKT